ncbi:MAG TPA: hypothetical protein VF407_15920 [Polyangiaceae bacterium]
MASASPTLLAFALVLGTTTLACGTTSAPPANGGTETSSGTIASNGTRDVHSIYRSRCGNCHVRVEPGTHTRSQLETAFARHHNRVKMNDAEWSNMVDFLASDAPKAAQAAPGSAKSSPISAEK